MSERARLTLYSDPLFERHETGQHPECADRLRVIRERLTASKLVEQTTPGKIRTATAEELSRIHPVRYQEIVRTFVKQGGGRLDPDTVVSPESADVATTAAGTVCAAVDEVLSGRTDRALCLTRPPGHHALPARAMGFCLFNNIAIAAAHARAAHELNRVLIVDWDVHHGNGTQDIFYEDGAVYFLSTHRYPFYPGTGADDETGTGPGLGAILNVPLKFGISRADFRGEFRRALEKQADKSRPELILISAGFDAHVNDPVGSLSLESEDFGSFTEDVLDIARHHCGGRVVSVLEGGYGLDELGESVESHLSALLKANA